MNAMTTTNAPTMTYSMSLPSLLVWTDNTTDKTDIGGPIALRG